MGVSQTYSKSDAIPLGKRPGKRRSPEEVFLKQVVHGVYMSDEMKGYLSAWGVCLVLLSPLVPGAFWALLPFALIGIPYIAIASFGSTTGTPTTVQNNYYESPKGLALTETVTASANGTFSRTRKMEHFD